MSINGKSARSQARPTTIRRGGQSRLFRAVIVLCLCFGLATTGAVSAQGLLSLVQKEKTAEEPPPQVTTQEFQDSLGVVIRTLENDQQRQQLLQQLKSLRQGAGSAAAAARDEAPAAGSLLDALSDAAQASENIDALDFVWIQRSRRALKAAKKRIADGDWVLVEAHVLQPVLWLSGWLAAWLLLMWAGKKLFAVLGWGAAMPRRPHLGRSLAHLARQILPWVLTLGAMLWLLRTAGAPSPVRIAVLTVIYIGLCGQVLASVAELVISWFADGHRRVAAQILLRRTLKPLFAVGALVALGGAAGGASMPQVMAPAVAQWLSDVANLLAAGTLAWLVLRNRRPVSHLILNRSYARRKSGTFGGDLLMLLARIWAPSTLFAIGCSIAAVVVAGADGAFARAALCAVLLFGMLIANALLLRHRNQVVQRRVKGDYKRRLVRFAYVLGNFIGWLAFAELILWIWGFSLLGFGPQPGISPLIGRTLFGVGITVLLAWLIWIFADNAIQRALHSSGRRSDKSAARAQTVTPMLRTVVFFTIVIIAAVVGLANLGVNVTPLLAGAGVIGLALGFGAQNLIQDLITGVFIVIEDSIAVGDFIKIGQYMGTVEGLNLRTVRLRDLDAVVHHITYSHIDSIHNMSREFGVALMKIRIPHDMPIDNAVTLMRETAMELRKDPNIGPLIHSPLEMQGIHSFDDGCPILRMRMRTKPEWQWDVGRAFNLLLKQRMERQQITLGAPRLTVSMAADGGQHFGSSSHAVPEINKARPGGP